MGKEAAGVPRAGAPHHPPFPGLHLARASSSRQRPPYPPHRPCKTPTHSVGTTHRQLGPCALHGVQRPADHPGAVGAVVRFERAAGEITFVRSYFN